VAPYTFPVTNDDVQYVPDPSFVSPNPVIELAVFGLIPASPVMWVAPVDVIAVFARITKLPAYLPRLTDAGFDGCAREASGNINATRTGSKVAAIVFIRAPLLWSEKSVLPPNFFLAWGNPAEPGLPLKTVKNDTSDCLGR
jgi:hypothetical protein